MFSLQTIFGSGKQFYMLLDDAARAAHDSANALHEILKAPPAHGMGLEAIKLARQRERDISDKISHALVDTFITPIEREDIEALQSALYRIPKQAERFVDRHALAAHRLDGRNDAQKTMGISACRYRPRTAFPRRSSAWVSPRIPVR